MCPWICLQIERWSVHTNVKSVIVLRIFHATLRWNEEWNNLDVDFEMVHTFFIHDCLNCWVEDLRLTCFSLAKISITLSSRKVLVSSSLGQLTFDLRVTSWIPDVQMFKQIRLIHWVRMVSILLTSSHTSKVNHTWTTTQFN